MFMMPEKPQKPIDTVITEVLNKIARDNGCKDWEDLDENGVFRDIENAVKLAFVTGSEWGKLEGAKAERDRILNKVLFYFHEGRASGRLNITAEKGYDQAIREIKEWLKAELEKNEQPQKDNVQNNHL